MRQFLKMLSLFALCFMLISVAFFIFIVPSFPVDLSSCPIFTNKLDKLKSHAQNLPRIVLVGGSNLYYGLEDSLIEAAFSNRYQVVDMGFHAGFGLGNMLEEVAPYLQSGDIVCLASEYSHWFGDAWSGGVAVFVYYLEYCKRPLYSLAFRSYVGLPRKSWGLYIQNKFDILLGKHTNAGVGLYDLSTVDSAPLPKYARFLAPKEAPFKQNELAFKNLERFKDDMEKRGVRIFLSAAAYDARYYALHRSEIAAAYDRIEHMGIPTISNPDDYAFPLEQMYDTKYHLNALGRTNRTLRIIHDLQQNL